MMSLVTNLPVVCYSVTTENVVMCYVMMQADAADHTDRALVNVTLHHCDVCSVSSPIISTDNEDLLSDTTLCSHVCVYFCVTDVCQHAYFVVCLVSNSLL